MTTAPVTAVQPSLGPLGPTSGRRGRRSACGTHRPPAPFDAISWPLPARTSPALGPRVPGHVNAHHSHSRGREVTGVGVQRITPDGWSFPRIVSVRGGPDQGWAAGKDLVMGATVHTGRTVHPGDRIVISCPRGRPARPGAALVAASRSTGPAVGRCAGPRWS